MMRLVAANIPEMIKRSASTDSPLPPRSMAKPYSAQIDIPRKDDSRRGEPRRLKLIITRALGFASAQY
jgi:hypothetical protein